jgi:hypothetical protein
MGVDHFHAADGGSWRDLSVATWVFPWQMLRRKPEPLDQVFEPRVRAQAIKDWVYVKVNQATRPFHECPS